MTYVGSSGNKNVRKYVELYLNSETVIIH